MKMLDMLGCLLGRHEDTEFTHEGGLYRYCFKCGRVELRHFHPRGSGCTPVVVPVKNSRYE